MGIGSYKVTLSAKTQLVTPEFLSTTFYLLLDAFGILSKTKLDEIYSEAYC